jgi:peptidoglycan/xylan/chitin deacetylase (PgdA/CDA1 family)
MRKQELGVLLLYYCGYSLIRKILVRLRTTPETRIIVFHEVPNEALRNFEANLRFLAEKTYVISLDDFFLGKLTPKRTNVVITFDDGYQNWVTNALPILKDLSLPATFFVTSGFVGLSKVEAAEFNKAKLHRPMGNGCEIDSLSREGLRTIIADGFTVGGHTKDHTNLGYYRDEIMLRSEIIGDKSLLEKMTGVSIDYFAYPGGVYHNSCVNMPEVLRQSGYKGAVTTFPGINTIKTNKFLLRRELIRASMPKRIFRGRIYGNYDFVYAIKSFFRMLRDLIIGKVRRVCS